MRRWIAALLLAAAALWQAPAHAQVRLFSQAELDALLAPIALYPDSVLTHVLEASTYPDDLREAAAWARANPHFAGEDAVRAAERMPWHPSVKALLALPELLARMDESPQWVADLAAAFAEQEPHVMDTVQALRRRAQANGTLRSNEYHSVQPYGESIAIYPAQPHVVYVPYYNPYVVYGPWWWHSYRPVYWRPWHPRPVVFVSTHFFHRHHRPHHGHHRHHIHQRHRHPAEVTIHNHAHPHRPIVQGARIAPAPAATPEHRGRWVPQGRHTAPRAAQRTEHRPNASSARAAAPEHQPRWVGPGSQTAPRAEHHREHRPTTSQPVHQVRPVAQSAPVARAAAPEPRARWVPQGRHTGSQPQARVR